MKWHWRWLVVMVVVTVAAYSSALNAPFVYDDLPAIQQNGSIRDLGALESVLSPPAQSPVAGRPAVNLSFAVNYAANAWLGIDQRSDPDGAFKTFGYHVVNVLLHVVCGLLLFVTMRRTMVQADAQPPETREMVSGLVALLWLLHPIQTDAVDYVTQRTELMVSLCYVATLYASIRAWTARDTVAGRWWSAAAITVCLIGMMSKEVMITAPIMIILYDRAFHASSWREVAKNRGRVAFYVGLVATSAPVFIALATGVRSQSAGFGVGIPWYQYFYTQAWAIGQYLRLIAWPNALTFDYGEALVSGLRGVPGLILLSICAIATIAAWVRGKRLWLAFLGAWFFLILAPSSSIVPIKTEIAAERRIYLASVPIFFLLVIGAERLRHRLRARPIVTRIAIGVVAAALAVATFARGLTYRTQESLHRDTIAKVPLNPRAYVGLGLAILQEGPARFDEAAASFKKAVTVDSSSILAWRSLGLLESIRSNWGEAESAYERVLRENSSDMNATAGVARAELHLGEVDAAKPHVDKLGTSEPELLWTIGNSLVREGRGAEAVPYLEAAAHMNNPPPLGIAILSLAYAQSGRVDEAEVAAQAATANGTGVADVFEVAGRAMLAVDRRPEARAYLEHALMLDPSLQFARHALVSLGVLK